MNAASLTAPLKRLTELGYALDSAPAEEAWSAALKEHRPAEAIPLLEGSLNERPDSVDARLWWVRCQLELGNLPLAALSAPLEEMFESLKNDKRLHRLGCSTFVRLGAVLLERNQARLAVAMLERAVELARAADALPLDQLQELDAFYTKCLEEEISKAPLRRESRQYLASLEEKLAEQKAANRRSAAKTPPPAEDGAKPARRRRLSSKEIAAQAAQEAPEQDPWDRPVSSKSSSEWRAFFFLLLVLLLIGGIAASTYIAFSGGERDMLETRLAMALTIPQPLQPAVPNPGPPGSTYAGDSSLDKVGERLQNLALSAAENGSASSQSNAVASSGTATLPAEIASSIPDEVPVDGGLSSLNGIPQAKNGIGVNKLPKASRDKFAKLKVEDVGTSGRKTPVDPSSSSDAGGATGPLGDRKALDGTPLRAYEVQRFDPPLLYQTITSTEVLAAPSLLAASLARLERGTRVHVTRRMGHWLELLSTGGRIGYIYAQDAEQVN